MIRTIRGRFSQKSKPDNYLIIKIKVKTFANKDRTV